MAGHRPGWPLKIAGQNSGNGAKNMNGSAVGLKIVPRRMCPSLRGIYRWGAGGGVPKPEWSCANKNGLSS
jgi:hypothetical protein